MVIRRRAIVQLRNDSEVLALIPVFQIKQAPGIVIVARRTWSVGHSVDNASRFGLDDDGIDIRTRPQVDCGRAEIVRRRQPIGSDLSLKAEVPLVDVRILDCLRIDRICASKRK